MSDSTILIPHLLAIDRAEELETRITERTDAEVVVTRSLEETKTQLRTATAVVTVQFPNELLDDAPILEWVHVISAGVDHLDLEAFDARGVAVTNSAGVHAEPIAEQVICYALLFERNLHRSTRNQSRRIWERVEGGEIRGKTMGIIGLGSIGSRIAELGAALDMTVIGTKRDVSDAPAVVDEVFPADEYIRVLGRSDYVVLACPLTSETEGLLGMREFSQMGNDTVLINIARGDVCVEEELVHALQEHMIRGAALDVFSEEPLPSESPLWRLSNVVVTPHNAGSSPHKFDRWADLIEQNYRALQGERADMVNRVV